MRVSDWNSTRFCLTVVAAMAFATVGLDHAARAASSDELAARRRQIAGMQPAEQQELLRKFERFEALPAEEQARLRALQLAIDGDPRSKQLHEVLDRYHEWLKTLTPAERADLADLPPEERVERVKRIQQRQQAARERAHQAELLTRVDVREIIRWAEDLAWKRREQITAHMPEKQRKYFEKNSPDRQKQMLLRMLVFERSRRGPSAHPLVLVEQGDVERLTKKLSAPAKEELVAAGDLSAQRKKLAGWVGTAMHLEAWQGLRRFGPGMSDDLAHFLQHDVPLDKRERLLKMQPDELRDEVRRMYFQRERGSRPDWPNGQTPDRAKSAPAHSPPAKEADGEAASKGQAEAAKP